MDILFHFVFSMIVGLVLVERSQHKAEKVLLAAIISSLIDIDHFFFFSPRGTFHNIFFVLGFPMMFFIYFYKNEKKGIEMQTFSLLLLVLLTGHTTADLFYGRGVKLLYPLSDESFYLPTISVFLTPNDPYSPIISKDGIVLTVYMMILLMALFIEDFIYFFRKKHRQFNESLKDALRDII